MHMARFQAAMRIGDAQSALRADSSTFTPWSGAGPLRA